MDTIGATEDVESAACGRLFARDTASGARLGIERGSDAEEEERDDGACSYPSDRSQVCLPARLP